jgi:uncharacterized protein with PIN domain
VASAPNHAHVCFHAELNDHLPPEQRHVLLEKLFFVPVSVKDLIESFGVPHTEVERVLVNGEAVDFACLVRNEDRIAVYPVSQSAEISPNPALRPPLQRPLRFVLDVHLGKLAAYLRMLGFDVFYRNCFSDPELANVSAEQRRVLLTRDRGLLKHSQVVHGYWLRETDSRRQTAEVLRRFGLAADIRPFTRCMACNGILREAAKERVRHLLPARVAEQYDDFRQCPECGRVYWKGTHHQRMRRWIGELQFLLESAAS